MRNVLGGVLKIGESRDLKKIDKVVSVINYLEPDMEGLTDSELKSKTAEFKKRLADGSDTLETLLPEAFAAAREAAKRAIGQRPYDVQLVGGVVLHQGKVAEMKTGEGKTLVATLPSYLNSLTGDSVHVVTVNDYLAERDAEWMGRIHAALGVSVGCVLSNMSTEERREAYLSDITYGTNNEFGFDYLRDNMALNVEGQVQRGHNYAIVDEVDSILIDEARTPLIISGTASKPLHWYSVFAKVVKDMVEDEHYVVDRKKRQIGVLEPAIDKVENELGIDNLYIGDNTPLVGQLMNAIKAKELFLKDKEYIVTKDGAVVIVDEHTGRTMAERRYSEGIHQAIEAKEKVVVKEENQTFATVTLQNYFKLYNKLSGMTGTAVSEAAELKHTYDLTVVPIPTNKPNVRNDEGDLIYQTENAKFQAVVERIKTCHNLGQPVLVGTVSVEKSEKLSKMLTKEKIPHKVLNAKNNTHEAKIVADAGRKGAVTVSTNMAGRGTDIVLGGNPEHIATVRLEKRGIFPKIEGGQITDGETLDGEGFLNAEEYNNLWLAEVEIAKGEVLKEHEEMVGLGGLLVIGTERHESRRIDNQLRGRAGRQGDPGRTQFYLSFEDELVKKFNLNAAQHLISRLNIPEDIPMRSKLATKLLENAQTQMETRNFDIRKEILKYDNVMDVQRRKVYHERNKILNETNITPHINQMRLNVLQQIVDSNTEGYPEDWNYQQIIENMSHIMPLPDTLTEETLKNVNDENEPTRENVYNTFLAESEKVLEKEKEEIGEGNFNELQRKTLLASLDRRWKDHLHEMDYLKNGISLRGFAQKDPVTEYRQEGYEMFNLMLDEVAYDTVKYLHHTPFIAETFTTYTPESPTEGTEPTSVGNVDVVKLASLGISTPTLVNTRTLLFKNLTPDDLDYIDTALVQRNRTSHTHARVLNSTPNPALSTTHLIGTQKDTQKGEKNQTGKVENAKLASGGTHTGITQHVLEDDNRDGLDKEVTVAGTVKFTAPRDQSVPEKYRGVAKNATCPCGSGKKFKRCHLPELLTSEVTS